MFGNWTALYWRFLFFFALLLAFPSCSLFKLDKESNCLNDKAACFKSDKTAPQLAAGGDVYPKQDQLVSVLNYIDVMFSEELNNPQPSDFTLTGAGQDLEVTSVQYLTGYTYRLMVTQRALVSGNIYLNFSNLKDYNGNKITGTTTIRYIGNIDIPITVPSVDSNGVAIVNPTHGGISGGTGYGTLDISWYYSYTPPAANPGTTVYAVKRTTGSQDCKDPAAVDISGLLVSPSPAAGTVTSYDGTDATTRANTTHKFTLSKVNAALPYPGSAISYTVLICVDNDVNNKHGKVALNIVRADSAPTTTLAQAPGAFAAPKTLAFSCSPFADKIAINTFATTDNATDPTGSVALPSFNATTGAITSGTQYDSANPWQTTYSTDPTWSAYKFSCIDQAGNIEAVKTKSIYKIDSRFPSVTITNIYKSGTTVAVTGASTAVGAYNNIDIVWKTNIANTNWELRKDGAACGSPSPLLQSPPTTPATANSLITTTFAASALATGTNQITLCVYSSGVGAWGQDSVNVVRDDSVPTISFNIGPGSYGSLQSIVPTCSTNGDKIIYSVASLAGGTAPTAPTAPTFDANGQLATGSTFGAPLVPQDGYSTTYVFRCINKGGVVNAAPVTATYKIDSVLPTISIVSNSRDYLSNVTGYTTTSLIWQSSRGGLSYQIQRGGTTCNGTNLTPPPGANLSGTTPSDTSQTITTTIDKANLNGGADGSYSIQICVQNFIGQYGYTSKTLVVDTVMPTFAGLTSLTIPAAGSATLTWAGLATDAASGVAFYRVYQTVTQGLYAVSPSYTVAQPTNSITVTGLAPATIYYFKVYAVDNAGNEQTTPTVELKSGFKLNVTASGLTGASPVNIANGADVLTFTTSATQTFGTVLATGSTYAVKVTTQPTGQNCAIVEKQFGSIAAADVTLSLKCVSGYVNPSGITANPPAKLSYGLYQGKVSALAGTGAQGFTDNIAGGSAQFYHPEYLATSGGILFVADTVNQRVRKIDLSTNFVSTLVGQGATPADNSTDDGPCSGGGSAKFRQIMGLASDGTNLYVAEWDNGRIRKVSDMNGAGCTVTTLAGSGVAGFQDGASASARFNFPRQVAQSGDYLYVADSGNNKIRRIALSTGIVDTIAGSGTPLDAAGTGVGASFSAPAGLAVVGNYLYVATETGGHLMRIDLATNVVTIVAGTGGNAHVDASAASAVFDKPVSLATDGFDLYVAELYNHTIRRIDIAAGHRVTTIAGAPRIAAVSAGTGPQARFNVPHGVATDGRYIYATNHTGHSVVKIGQNGLAGHWPLVGQRVADYSSDNASSTTNDGTELSSSDSTATDRYNLDKSKNFAGAERVAANLGGLPSGTNARSICVWAKPTAQPVSNAIIASWGGASADASFGIYVTKTTNSNQIGITTYGGGTDIVSGQPLLLNEWSHVCATYSGFSSSRLRRLYLNGKLLVQDTTSTSVSATGAVTIGGQQGNFDYFTGAIADVRIYSRALNEGEINDLAQDASATQAGPSFSSGATGLLSHYEINNNAQLLPSGPVGGNLVSSGSYPIGIHGDAGGAFYYNGSTNNSSSGYGLPVGNAPRSMCIWVKPQVSPVNQVLVAHGAATANQAFGMTLDTNAVSLWVFGNATAQFSYVPKLNTWQHICGTFDGSTGKVYIDGVSYGAQVVPAATSLNTTGSAIGIGSNVGGGNIFQGTLDDVRIYNTVLSAGQIRQLSALVPTGLVFRMDTNGDALDVSGFGSTLASNAGSLTTGRAGTANTAYAFSTGQYAAFNHNATLMGQQDMTWSFWLKSRTMSGLSTELFTKYQSPPAAGWVFKYDQSNYMHGWTLGTSGSTAFAKGSRINANNVWNHYAFVRSGSTMTLYQNGASITVSQASDASSVSLNTATMKIGSVFSGDLMIQDARLYSRALTLAELQTLSGYHVHQTGAGLRLHLQAETFSDLTDGAVTGNWLDSAPQPYDANYPSANTAQAVVTGSPSYQASGINGRPSVTFDATTLGYYSYGGGDTISYSGATFCTVATRKSSGSAYRGLMEKRSTIANGSSIGVLNDTVAGAQTLKYEEGGGGVVAATIADGTPAIYCVVHSAPSNLTQTVNGTAFVGASNPVITGANSDPLFIGTRYTTPHTLSDQYFGTVGEIILTVKDSSATELKVAQCYLSAKYGIALDSTVICP